MRLNAQFVEDYRALVAQLFQSELRSTPYMQAVLEEITLPKCVASNSPPEKIRQALQITKLDRFFGDKLFSSHQIQSWRPEPDLFLHAAHSMGFALKSCAMVEDSVVGVEAASRAGMQAFFYDPSNGLEPKIMSYVLIEDMRDLPQAPRRSTSSKPPLATTAIKQVQSTSSELFIWSYGEAPLQQSLARLPPTFLSSTGKEMMYEQHHHQKS